MNWNRGMVASVLVGLLLLVVIVRVVITRQNGEQAPAEQPADRSSTEPTIKADVGQPVDRLPVAPALLLIYYGYPSGINGARDLETAAAEFAQYDFVVLGDGLQDATHDDHNNTIKVIQFAKQKNATIQFFGYIPLGNRPKMDRCLSFDVITKRLKEWVALGVVGVLFDEFGFDYGVTRDRQNQCVVAAHQLELRVMANAWNPDHVFRPDQNDVEPALNKNDIYLWESYRLINGKPVSVAAWRAKAAQIEKGRDMRPLAVFSVSTNLNQNGARGRFAHQWLCAALDGHAATGWGYHDYGSSSKAPFVPPPLDTKEATAKFGARQGPLTVNGSNASLITTQGQIIVDAAKLDGSFEPTPAKK